MAAHDIVLVEKYTLTSWLLASLGVKYKEKCLANYVFGSVQKIRRLDNQSKFQMFILQYLSAAILEDHGGPPTWQIRTKLYNFAWDISTNIPTFGTKHTCDLKLGETCFSILSSIISQFLDFIRCMVFYFISITCQCTHTTLYVSLLYVYFQALWGEFERL